MQLTAPHLNPHAVLNWLGAAVVALLALVGLLYTSAYIFGIPSLPNPDDRRHHMREINKCEPRKMT